MQRELVVLIVRQILTHEGCDQFCIEILGFFRAFPLLACRGLLFGRGGGGTGAFAVHKHSMNNGGL